MNLNLEKSEKKQNKMWTINRKFYSRGLLKMVLPLFVLLLAHIAASAQTPNLEGDWAGYFPDGSKSTFVWRIGQTDANLWFEEIGAGTKTNFTGQIANGKITDSNRKTGIISDNNKKITWNDGFTWLWQAALPPRKFPESDPPPGEAIGSTAKPTPLIAPRFSFDSNPYVFDSTNKDKPFKWSGEKERTIYNPLDGGILLKYTFSSQANADGCSGGFPREKEIFLQACLAHDTNYDAPFPLAGFPGYSNGISTGQEISDYLFFKDMQLINDQSRGSNNGFTNFKNDVAAKVFYTAVTLFGKFRGKSDGKTVLEKGGVVAVQNDSNAYTLTLKVTWNGPDGTPRSAEVTKPVNQTAVIPLSFGATNIKIECSAVGGTTIFSRKFEVHGMFTYTVTGTTLTPGVQDGLMKTRK